MKTFTFAPKPTRYGGVLYRSRTEARWALFFDALGIRANYEFEGFDLDGGGYLPDFWLPRQKLFVEVKGAEPTVEEIAKCDEVARKTEANVLIAPGPPAARFELMWFDRDGLRDERYVFAWDKIAECGPWLLGEETANWLGPTRVGDWPRGPMMTGALEEAYRLAADARFEARGDLAQRPIGAVEWEYDRLAVSISERAA